MSTLKIELSDELAARLEAVSAAEQMAPTEWAKEAVVKALPVKQAADSQQKALEVLHDLVGCFDSGVTDLATNPKCMEGFGKWRE